MMLSLTIENSEGGKQNIDINHIIQETINSIHTVLKPNLLNQIEKVDDINDIAPGYIALKPSALVDNPREVLLNFQNETDPIWVEKRTQLIENCSKINEIIFQLNNDLFKLYPERKAPFFVCTIDAVSYTHLDVYKRQEL